MTLSERRSHPRFYPDGLKANIQIENGQSLTFLEGEVIDISFTGIKIRLKTPSSWDMEGKIKIDLHLPDTGIPFSINGILRHQSMAGDLGIEYVDASNVVEMDKFIFECYKRAKDDGSAKN